MFGQWAFVTETLKEPVIDLYTFSETVTIDGIVTGDLISFGRSVYINGQVYGDIIVFCETIDMKGTTEDDFRAFARKKKIEKFQVSAFIAEKNTKYIHSTKDTPDKCSSENLNGCIEICYNAIKSLDLRAE